MKQIINYLVIFIFFISCDMSKPVKNDILDHSRPLSLINLKNANIEVFDLVNKKMMGKSADYQLFENYFQVYLKTILFLPPNNSDKDIQSKYRVTIESKDNIFIDNIDSLFIDANLEIQSVAFWDKNFELGFSLYHTRFLNLNNPKISYRVYAKILGEDRDLLLQNNTVVSTSNLKKIVEDELPFKLKVILHVISGEDQRVNMADPWEPPSFVNPLSQARYRLYFQVKGLY